MTNQHPITPPPKLIQQWRVEFFEDKHRVEDTWGTYFATQAAQWGADQELEECWRWMRDEGYRETAQLLHSARRPKPLSLKEQALAALEQVEADFNTGSFGDTIRRALETLDD